MKTIIKYLFNGKVESLSMINTKEVSVERHKDYVRLFINDEGYNLNSLYNLETVSEMLESAVINNKTLVLKQETFLESDDGFKIEVK